SGTMVFLRFWIQSSAAFFPVMLMSLLNTAMAVDPARDYPISPVSFTEVQLGDGFWLGRIETNRQVTIPYDFQKCEETGRIANFEVAAGKSEGKHQGFWFNDSDVFKVVEGTAYSLALHPDEKLEKYLDDLIGKFAAAQQPDGYLYTIRTIHGEEPFRLQRYTGKKRWSYLEHSHELYNVGHLYEAAVAHHAATGKRSLLDVALKSADLVDTIFGPEEGKKIDVPGHQEIELGLVKLYRATGDSRYLKLAKFFLDHRGVPDGRKDNRVYGKYWQDHLPVTQQTEAVGHAVRAAYMYSAMADVAALTGETSYISAIDRLWDNVVGKKMYLTGGIGSRHHEEAFGENYELPNDTAYNETCAAIGNAIWNHRMFLLHGDGKYIDVLERVIYNGFLAGVSLRGNEFFYPNPLSCNAKYPFNKGNTSRSPWFDCSCCPVNIVRFLPSIAGYVYANSDSAVYVNLFVPGHGTVEHQGQSIKLTQQTNYPWDGLVTINVDPEQSSEFELRVRIPGWAVDQPVPSDLYRYLNESKEPIALKVNGEEVQQRIEKGFAVIKRTWDKGDVVQLSLPMPVRRVVCNDQVQANRGRVALERGPIVYCLEGLDNRYPVDRLLLPDDAHLKVEKAAEMFGGVEVLRGQGLYAEQDSADLKEAPLVAIPYYAWSHRGPSEMVVWLPRDEKTVRQEKPQKSE
ncbi:MAG: glycoside hydrolase family 127 protein, partial [Planctomycetales bacterium]